MVISEVKFWSSEAAKNFFISFKGDKFLSLIMTGTCFFKTAWKQLLLLRPQGYVYVFESILFRMRNRWRVWGFLHSYYCIYSDIEIINFFVCFELKWAHGSFFFFLANFNIFSQITNWKITWHEPKTWSIASWSLWDLFYQFLWARG